jgi:hypothetical protein
MDNQIKKIVANMVNLTAISNRLGTAYDEMFNQASNANLDGKDELQRNLYKQAEKLMEIMKAIQVLEDNEKKVKDHTDPVNDLDDLFGD